MVAGHSVALAVWAAVYIAYAVLDEWLQQFVGRTTSFVDWLADVAGVLAMSLALLGFRRRATA